MNLQKIFLRKTRDIEARCFIKTKLCENQEIQNTQFKEPIVKYFLFKLKGETFKFSMNDKREIDISDDTIEQRLVDLEKSIEIKEIAVNGVIRKYTIIDSKTPFDKDFISRELIRRYNLDFICIRFNGKREKYSVRSNNVFELTVFKNYKGHKFAGVLEGKIE